MRKTTLVDRLIGLHARLNTLHTKFGEKQYLPVVLHHHCTHGFDIKKSFHLITPYPRVEHVSNRFVGLQVAENIYIAANDIQVSEVVRTEDLDWFRQGVEYYVINPEINEENEIVLNEKNVPTRGEFYRLLYILDKDVTTITLILRGLRDEY